MVVAGVAQALALTAQVLVDRGHRDIAVEDPGSQGTREELERWGLRTRPVPVDGDGMDVDALARHRGEHRPAHPRPPVPHRRRAEPASAAGPSSGGRPTASSSRTTTTPSTATTAPRCPRSRGSAPTGWCTRAASPRRSRRACASAGSSRPRPCARRSPGPSTWPISATPCSTSWCSPASSPRASSSATCAACGSAQRARRDAMLGALREHLPHAQVLGVAAGLHLLVTLPRLRRRRAGGRGGRGGRARPPALDPPDHARTARARARLRRAGAGPHPRGDRPARRGVPLCRTPGSARVTARA